MTTPTHTASAPSTTMQVPTLVPDAPHDAPHDEGPPLTPRRVRALLDAGVLDDAGVRTALDVIDESPGAGATWRGFSEPLGAWALGLFASAIAVAVAGMVFDDAQPAKLIAGACALGTAIGGIAMARRARIGAAGILLVVQVLLGAAVIAARSNGSIHQDTARGLLAVFTLGAVGALVWLVARPRYRRLEEVIARALPHTVHTAARAALMPASALEKAGAIALWVVGAAALFVVAGFPRQQPSFAMVLGALVLFGFAAFGTRRRRLPLPVRHAALFAAAAALYILAEVRPEFRHGLDGRMLAGLTTFAVAFAASSSRLLRLAAFAGALALALSATRWLGPVESADDALAVLACALVTSLFLRDRTHGVVARPSMQGFVLLALGLASMEIPAVGRAWGLGLGSATSLGVLACGLATAAAITAGQRPAVRALVGGLVLLIVALLINHPALLIGMLLVALAHHRHDRGVGAVASLALAAFIGGTLAGQYGVDSATAAGLLGIGGALVLAARMVLRRIPA